MTLSSGYGTRSQLHPTEIKEPRVARDPGGDLLHYLRSYAQERPEVAALWCFGIGFVLGWKLKPW